MAIITMFLLNPYTNDARVRREVQTLLTMGHQVHIVALQTSAAPFLPAEEVQENGAVHVYRVSRKVWLFDVSHNVGRRLTSLWRRKTPGVGAGGDVDGTKGRLPFLRYLRRTVIMFRMIAQGLRTRATIYHAHDLNTLPVGVICRILRPKPLVYDAHEVATGRVGHNVWYMTLLERFCLLFVNKVITTTSMRANFLSHKYDLPPPTVVGNVIDLALTKAPKRNLHRELGIPPEQPLIIYQGGVQAGRGLEQILYSLGKWHNGVLLIVGDGALLPTLRKLTAQLGLNDRVRFTGRVPLEQLLGYTKAATIGLQVLQNTCFNHFSTDSNKLFEYFAAGVPVIASDFPEIRTVVSEFGSGLLVDPHDPDTIAGAVNYLLSHGNERERLAANALRAAQSLNWEHEARKLMELYQSLLPDTDRLGCAHA